METLGTLAGLVVVGAVVGLVPLSVAGAMAVSAAGLRSRTASVSLTTALVAFAGLWTLLIIGAGVGLAVQLAADTDFEGNTAEPEGGAAALVLALTLVFIGSSAWGHAGSRRGHGNGVSTRPTRPPPKVGIDDGSGHPRRATEGDRRWRWRDSDVGRTRL